MTEPVIRFDRVSKRFSDKDGRELAEYAVKDLSFEVASGELIAVVWRTGCGKSTMFNLLAGLLEPTSGTVRVYGHDPFRELKGTCRNLFHSQPLSGVCSLIVTNAAAPSALE